MAEEKAGERIYTIPLRREWLKQTRVQRANRAVRAVQAFLIRHMKASEVKISPKLNELIWKSGAKKPPARVRVKARKDSKGVVTAQLPEEIETKEESKGKLSGLKEKVIGKNDKQVLVEESEKQAKGKKPEKNSEKLQKEKK